ncbi:MAG: MATE family efflux transporter [Bacilli bacterium]
MFQAWKDRTFMRTIFALALPITIQCFITSSLNLIDNLMVGRLGEASIAAVGLANQYMFIFLLCIFGINAGASIFMSQFWGQRNLKQIRTFLGVDLVIGLIAAIIFGAGALFFPEQIMGVLSQDQEVIMLGAEYLQIVAISCIVVAVTQGYSAALRSTGQPRVPMYGSLIGVILNAGLNYVFIFGAFGVPAMGVAGAALATTIARVVEMLFVVGYVYVTKNAVAARLKDLLSFNVATLRTYWVTSWSVILNELVWSIGMSAYAVAYAQIGTNAVATMQIATTLFNMFLVILIGLANAAAIIIGMRIGANEEAVAKKYARYIAETSIVVGVVLGVFLWFSAPALVSFFEVSEQTYADTISVLKVMSLFFVLRSFTLVMIIGVFRGGGDTLYSMLLQSCSIWLYSVPLAFFGASYLELSVVGVFILISTEEFIKTAFMLQRLRGGKWIHNVIDQMAT